MKLFLQSTIAIGLSIIASHVNCFSLEFPLGANKGVWIPTLVNGDTLYMEAYVPLNCWFGVGFSSTGMFDA